jgi:hypothetical protein
MSSDRIREQHYYVNLFHISSKFEFFIGVDMFMCRALICVEEIRVHYHDFSRNGLLIASLHLRNVHHVVIQCHSDILYYC